MSDLIIDSFAGGGGASTGIAWALGRGPDIAINHDAHELVKANVNMATDAEAMTAALKARKAVG